MYVLERWDSAVGLYVILKVFTLWIIGEMHGISYGKRPLARPRYRWEVILKWVLGR
jgi:hypothetical protein